MQGKHLVRVEEWHTITSFYLRTRGILAIIAPNFHFDLFLQSNSQNLFAQSVQNKLLPDHTYSVVSGGDPAYIPDLTWKQLRQFHASHYHPSNAR